MDLSLVLLGDGLESVLAFLSGVDKPALGRGLFGGTLLRQLAWKLHPKIFFGIKGM
jgi:hypothetical protein